MILIRFFKFLSLLNFNYILIMATLTKPISGIIISDKKPENSKKVTVEEALKGKIVSGKPWRGNRNRNKHNE